MMANIYWINKLYNVRTVVALSFFFGTRSNWIEIYRCCSNILNRSIFFSLCVCFFHILLVFQVGIVDDGY